jgi:glucose dehydrogenase
VQCAVQQRQVSAALAGDRRLVVSLLAIGLLPPHAGFQTPAQSKQRLSERQQLIKDASKVAWPRPGGEPGDQR